MAQPLVAILGTRYQDFSIEEETLGPLGVRLVSGDGDTPADIMDVASGAAVVMAGSQPAFTADVASCRV